MTRSVDILLYVALSEEADSVLEMLGDRFLAEELSDLALTAFVGTLAGPTPNRDFKVAAIPAGKMGNTRSATVVSALIEKLRPTDVVVVGIAGSLASDMEPGDVFIPDSVNEYLANSATHGEKDRWTFSTSGNHFQTSGRLLNRFQNFSRTHKLQYRIWEDEARGLRTALIPLATEVAMATAGLQTRGICKLYSGDDRKLASGPAVGKGKAFVDWITREVDRKVAAMEMESAGVYDAAIVRTPAPRTVAIRGISDYADARKDKIESIAKVKFRALSAKNAVALFMRAVEAGLFEADAVTATGPAGSAAEATTRRREARRTPRTRQSRSGRSATPSLSERARSTYRALINYLLGDQRPDGLFSSYNLHERRPSATATSIALLALHECDEVETSAAVERAVDSLIHFRETVAGIVAWPAQTGENLHTHNNAWAILAISRVRGVAGVRLIGDTVDWIVSLQDAESGAFPFFADAEGRFSSQATAFATASVIRALLAFLDNLVLMPDEAPRAAKIRAAISKGLGFLEAVNAALRSLGRIGWAADKAGDLVPCLATTSLAAHAILRAHQQDNDQGGASIDYARLCMVEIARSIADAKQTLKDTKLTVKHDGATTDLVTWPIIHVTDPAQYFFSYYTPVILRTFIDSGLLQAHETLFKTASRKIVRWMVDGSETSPGQPPPLVNVHAQRFGTWVAGQAALTLGGALRRRADWFA